MTCNSNWNLQIQVTREGNEDSYVYCVIENGSRICSCGYYESELTAMLQAQHYVRLLLTRRLKGIRRF